MANAATIAGLAFSNAFVGVNHALAHAVGARFGVAHGRANGLFLPHVLRYNAALPRKFMPAPGYGAYVAPAKLAQMAWVLGLGGHTEEIARERLFERVDAVLDEVGMPRTVPRTPASRPSACARRSPSSCATPSATRACGPTRGCRCSTSSASCSARSAAERRARDDHRRRSPRSRSPRSRSSASARSSTRRSWPSGSRCPARGRAAPGSRRVVRELDGHRRRGRGDAALAAGLHARRGRRHPLARAEAGTRVLRRHQAPAQPAARRERRRRSRSTTRARAAYDAITQPAGAASCAHSSSPATS